MAARVASPGRLPIDSMQNPFTRSINPHPTLPPTYNFHDRNPPSPSLSSPYAQARPEPILSENLNLADQHSFARNFKGRLYGVDQNQEDAKALKQQKYRQELLMQAEEDRRRKREAKERADAEDKKLEDQFYAKISIEAQKRGLKKEEPSYFMMRTVRSNINKQNSLANSRAQSIRRDNFVDPEEKKGIAAEEFSKKENLKRTLYDHKIIKRGGYHNQSSLDPKINPEENEELQPPQSPQYPKDQYKRLSQSLKPRQEDVKHELEYEEQRIHQILMFQEHMLKKLDYFKKDVIVASQSLRLEEELDKVRLKLRAKPLNLEKIYHLNPREGVDNLIENNSFYNLPLISPRNKVYEGSRELKKRRDKEKHRQLRSQESENEETKEVVKLEDRRKVAFNDKNIPTSGGENEEAPEPEA